MARELYLYFFCFNRISRKLSHPDKSTFTCTICSDCLYEDARKLPKIHKLLKNRPELASELITLKAKLTLRFRTYTDMIETFNAIESEIE